MSAVACAGTVQYGHVATGTPIGAGDLRAPERERGGDAPRAARDGQRRDVDQGKTDRAGDERPWPAQPARTTGTRRARALEASMPAPFDEHREIRDRAEEREAPRQRERSAVTRAAATPAADCGRLVHHGTCAVPMTDPAMNAASVTSMRVLPPPAL